MVNEVTTPWLNDEEMRAWRSYADTVIDLQNALERDLAPHGLTFGDYQVLVFLSEAPDHRMRMRELADRLQLSPSGLTRRLDGLVKHRHVRREPAPDDGRSMMAVLTPAGYSLLADTAPHHVRSVRAHILDRLSSEQVSAMADIFEAIAAGLAEPAGEPSIVSSPAPSPVAPQPAASPTASDLLTR